MRFCLVATFLCWQLCAHSRKSTHILQQAFLARQTHSCRQYPPMPGGVLLYAHNSRTSIQALGEINLLSFSRAPKTLLFLLPFVFLFVTFFCRTFVVCFATLLQLFCILFLSCFCREFVVFSAVVLLCFFCSHFVPVLFPFLWWFCGVFVVLPNISKPFIYKASRAFLFSQMKAAPLTRRLYRCPYTPSVLNTPPP